MKLTHRRAEADDNKNIADLVIGGGRTGQFSTLTLTSIRPNSDRGRFWSVPPLVVSLELGSPPLEQ